jgi:hypothetical protein
VTAETPGQAAADWWVCTGILPPNGDGLKVAGPFATQELALNVRTYVEKAERRSDLWVDDEPQQPQSVPEQVRLARQDRDQLRKAVLDLAAKWDATADRNQRNGQSLVDQGDEYGNEGLAVAEALGACVVELRKIAEPPS